MLQNNEPTWSNIDKSGCKPLPPLNLQYNESITLYREVEIETIYPKHINTIREYYIKPTLPTGVIFDPLYGTIFGKPLYPSQNTSYIITGINKVGTVTCEIYLQVLLVECKNDGIWKATERGTNLTIECGNNEAGFQTRRCGESYDLEPKWYEIDRSDCVKLKSNPDSGLVNIDIKIIIQISDINIASYSSILTYEEQNLLRQVIRNKFDLDINNIIIISITLLVY